LAGYFTTDIPENISGAIVSISDEDNNIFYLYENEDDPGLYQTADNVYGEEGKTYTLNVQFDMYRYSASARMTRNNDIDSVRLLPSMFSENRVEVRMYMDNIEDLPDENLYTIFVSLNDSLLNSTINRYRVMQNIVSGMRCYVLRQIMEEDEDEEDSRLLRPGDKVSVNINAISQEYADFISAAQTELRDNIPIFSGPPANVPTNIRGDKPALGFFTAFSSRHAFVRHE